jgi:hypothetical protein
MMMANFKRRKPRKQVKCVLCTDNRTEGRPAKERAKRDAMEKEIIFPRKELGE